MADEERPGIASLLGYLRDSGYSEVTVRRIERLYEASKMPVDEFLKLGVGKIAGLYNSLTPENTHGAGKKTLEAFDRLSRHYRTETLFAAKAAAAESDEAARVEDVAKKRLEDEFLGLDVDLNAMSEVVAGLSTMFGSCTLKMLLDVYRRKLEGGPKQA